MSISTESVIMVGLPYEELAAFLGSDEVREKLDDGELESGSYGYDSNPDENIIGHKVVRASYYKLIEKSDLIELLSVMEDFEISYGIKAKVYLTLNIN